MRLQTSPCIRWSAGKLVTRMEIGFYVTGLVALIIKKRIKAEKNKNVVKHLFNFIFDTINWAVITG